MSREDREREGRRAEAHVARWLKLRGWKLLAERFKCAEGELDLIARKGEIIAFVEVKQRTRVDPREDIVTASGERRMMDAAEVWVGRNYDTLGTDFEIRFDLAVIEGPVRPLSKVSYIPNAFVGGW
jgi:putative endonuclease